MPYCETCGAQISAKAKFCGSCGAVRTQPDAAETKKPDEQAQPVQAKREPLSYYSPPPANAYVPPPPVPIMGTPTAQQSPPSVPMQQPFIPQTQPVIQQVAPQPVIAQPVVQAQQPLVQQPGGETPVGVIVLRKPKSMGRWDTFTGVITTHRLIFAQMTSQMLTDAAQQSREQAKADGKGFFGQWADQLRATFGYSQRYLSMSPQAILAETPGNFAIDNNTISRINVHLKGAHNQRNQRREFELKFYTSAGTYQYMMDENSDFINSLKQVYGQRVDMPFGYLGGVNIKIGI